MNRQYSVLLSRNTLFIRGSSSFIGFHLSRVSRKHHLASLHDSGGPGGEFFSSILSFSRRSADGVGGLVAALRRCKDTTPMRLELGYGHEEISPSNHRSPRLYPRMVNWTGLLSATAVIASALSLSFLSFPFLSFPLPLSMFLYNYLVCTYTGIRRASH